jgi:hypothetical protein
MAGRKRIIDLTQGESANLADKLPVWKGTDSAGSTVWLSMQQIMALVEPNTSQPQTDSDIFEQLPL